MQNARATSSIATPRRVGELSSRIGGATYLIQPNRLDVLVHLLAFEQVVGTGDTQRALASSSVDWLARSEALSIADNDVSVPALAAELMTSPGDPLEVSFASGGQLVRGASIAAAALHSGREIVRVDVTDRVLDRSYVSLVEQGWSATELGELLGAWIRIDPAAAVVLIDLDAQGSSALEHEIECRYPVIFKTVTFLSKRERIELAAARSGSVRAMFVRSSGPVFAQVLDAHREALALTRRGADVAPVIDLLHDECHPSSTSPAHEQRLRRDRRQHFRDQLLVRLFGR